MSIIPINKENIADYSDLVDGDVAENIGRMYYRGVAVHDPDDNSPLSLLIWELKSVEAAGDTESELKWLYAADPSFILPLFDEYSTEILFEGVKRTALELPASDTERSDAMSECGFTFSPAESRYLDVSLRDFKELSFIKKKAPSYIMSIDDLDDREYEQGLMNIMFRFDDPALEDLSYLPKDWYEQTVSCCVKTDGKINGFLLVHACPSGILIPVLFFAVGADFKMNLIEMMRFSVAQAAVFYSDKTTVRINRRNRTVHDLTKKFFPDKKGGPVIAGERRENG